ncbi:hypothetical protein T492DRAFT_999497 [Pavlovales sp. CCMP2436]|nr:hypothetical protein T492DRAFT_999497 [Pavlovales sp. CCMP2436]|mmetsp:Transcript_36022/g.89925  ORF Transcript_36022/g.89925 Transcript_36022/m.89925 type:complete len:429 (+) Transcript_36022:97-1383(+)
MLAPRSDVRIAGGGPAGLLLALLLGRHPELNVHVHERAAIAENFSARSYAIALNPRGIGALERAGGAVVDELRTLAGETAREVEVRVPGCPPSVNPRAPSLRVTRPSLVECLSRRLAQEASVAVHLGSAVEGLRRVGGGQLEIDISDSRTARCSHLVGCDGKWSRVRASADLLACAEKTPTGWQPELVEEGSWGVLLQPKPGSAEVPGGLDPERFHVFQSRKNALGLCYALLVPLPPALGGWHATVVLFEPILHRDALLAPPAAPEGDGFARLAAGERTQWGGGAPAEPSVTPARAAALERLVAAELPNFLPVLRYSEITEWRPRASWVRLGGPTYAAIDGRVVLLGDAAHSMTASMGEGANTALESAALLANGVAESLRGWREAGSEPSQLDAALSAAFCAFGSARVPAARELQARSAAASRPRLPP